MKKKRATRPAALSVLSFALLLLLFATSPVEAQVYTMLHDFSGSDGWEPRGSLVLGNDGQFYGVTTRGGVGNG